MALGVPATGDVESARAIESWVVADAPEEHDGSGGDAVVELEEHLFDEARAGFGGDEFEGARPSKRLDLRSQRAAFSSLPKTSSASEEMRAMRTARSDSSWVSDSLRLLRWTRVRRGRMRR